MDHLAEAKRLARCAGDTYPKVDKAEWVQVTATLAVTHALIAIAERMPPPAEEWSESGKRLRQEEQDGV